MAISQGKAKEILRHGSVRGRPLTAKQKGYMGAVAGESARKQPATSKHSQTRRIRSK